MIVCRECGSHNDDGDMFCGGCPAFLEWSGEHVDDGLPEPVTEAETERAGIVTRIRHAISGDEQLPPPAGQSQVATPPSSLPPPPQYGTTDDRASALVAKPVIEERPTTERPTLATPDAGGAAGPGPSSPQAQAPQAAKARPKVQRQAPSRKINPGDLICGQCGEGNPSSRKFCRRCGNTLEEAVVAKRPWYRRVLPSRRKKGLTAGERPDRTTGRPGSKARVFRGKALGKYADLRRILALLAIVGIGVGFALPSARSAIMDGGSSVYNRVRRVISPTYSNIPIDPARVSASSETPDGEAENVTDSNTLTYWLAAPDDPDASVTVVFVETTDLKHVLVHPGKQENGGKVLRPDPRPRELLFRVTDDAGTITEVNAILADEDGFQTIDLDVDAAVSAEAIVVNCFPDPVVTVCPVTELEFQQQD